MRIWRSAQFELGGGVANDIQTAILELVLSTEGWMGSRRFAPTIRGDVKVSRGVGTRPRGEQAQKSVIFGSFRVRQPVKGSKVHREGSELSHIPTRCIAFEC